MCFRWKRRGDSKEASGYWLLVSPSGGWRFVRWDGTKPVPLTAWTQAGAVRRGAGARNTVAVVCRGDQIVALVNGLQVGEVRDDTYLDSGGVGPMSGSSDGEVAYRNLKIDPGVMPPVGVSTPQPLSPGSARDRDLLQKVLDLSGTK